MTAGALACASLGSGSRGNATLIRSAETLILLDCGFGVRDAERRLDRLGHRLADIDAVVVTHEHSDHVSGVARVARRADAPVYATHGTAIAARRALAEQPRLIDPHVAFEIGDVTVQPFPVPHDAREPVQFVFCASGIRLGVVSDLGCATPHLETSLRDCDALMLEANHDPEMLAQGPYPESLKRRVASRLGHLSNQQSAELIRSVQTERLQFVVLTHLSETNNCPERARAACAAATGHDPDWFLLADQSGGIPWHPIHQPGIA